MNALKNVVRNVCGIVGFPLCIFGTSLFSLTKDNPRRYLSDQWKNPERQEDIDTWLIVLIVFVGANWTLLYLLIVHYLCSFIENSIS